MFNFTSSNVTLQFLSSHRKSCFSVSLFGAEVIIGRLGLEEGYKTTTLNISNVACLVVLKRSEFMISSWKKA